MKFGRQSPPVVGCEHWLSTFGDRHAILSSTMLVFGFCFIGSCFCEALCPRRFWRTFLQTFWIC